MKKGRKHISSRVKKRSHNTVFYPVIILLVAFLSSFITLLAFQSRTRLEAVLGSYTFINPKEYSENTHPQNNISDVINHGDRNEKKIALTFDADMTPFMYNAVKSHHVSSSYNKSIIDILENTQTPATLFLSGMWIELYTQDAKKLAENPLFELGNHSYSHPGFDGACFGLTPLPDSEDIEEIGITQKLLKDLTGHDNILFRFPGGCFSSYDVRVVKSAGMQVVHWDVAGEDGFNESASAIENNVLSHTQNGSIIVLHMNGAPTAPKTAFALQKIISELKNRGFEFVTASNLLKLI